MLAALLLAGVRNVQPRPSVGFKFHAVLVVNSAHLASLASADERPLAADLLGPRLLQRRAGAGRARGRLDDAAGRRSDAARAAQARAGVSPGDGPLGRAGGRRRRGRAGPLGQADENSSSCSVRYGARDFRSIGHKAIYVANAIARSR